MPNISPIEVLKDNLYSSTKTVLEILGYEDIVVLFSHEDVMSPDDEYCVINIIMINQTGESDKSSAIFRATMSDEIDFVSHYIVTVQYSFIGKNSSLYAMEFQHSMHNNNICRGEFTYNNLGYLNKTPLRNVPQRWETQWVDGWNIDINFTYSMFTKHKFDWIEKVIIEGNGVVSVAEYTE